MKSHTLSCGNCGAPLEVEEGIHFITCKFCASRLEIQESDSTRYTKVIHELQKDKKKMAANNEILRMEKRLTEMDRKWDHTKEQYMNYDNGRKTEPSKTGALLTGVFGTVSGIVLMALSVGETENTLYGILLILVSLAAAVYQSGKSNQLDSRRRSYQHSRERLIKQIDNMKKNRNKYK